MKPKQTKRHTVDRDKMTDDGSMGQRQAIMLILLGAAPVRY